MSNVGLSSLLLALALALMLPGRMGQLLPEAKCRSIFASYSQNDLLLRLAPCQRGATASCCEAGQNLAGFNDKAPLPGCLCYRAAIEELISNAEANMLARAAGVNRAFIVSILQQCGAPFFGGTGASRCPVTSAPVQLPGDPAPPEAARETAGAPESQPEEAPASTQPVPLPEQEGPAPEVPPESGEAPAPRSAVLAHPLLSGHPLLKRFKKAHPLLSRGVGKRRSL